MNNQKWEKDRKKKIEQATSMLEQGVKNLLNSDEYKKYLMFLSKFYDYSHNNTILLYLQCPDGQHFAGYNKWQELGRKVKKGQKGYKVFAPCIKKVSKIPELAQKLKKELNEDPALLEKKLEEKVIVGFTLKSVFEASQTTGEELPTICHSICQDVKDYEKVYSALKQISPYEIKLKDLSRRNKNLKGYCDYNEKIIVVRDDMSEIETLKTTVHETAHALLHNKEINSKANNITRNMKEVQAESIAFVVCDYFNLDTSDYSFGYLAGWEHDKETLNDFKNSLEEINKCSNKIIKGIEKHAFNNQNVGTRALNSPTKIKKPPKPVRGKVMGKNRVENKTNNSTRSEKIQKNTGHKR